MNWSVLHDKVIVRRAPEVAVVAGLEVPEQAREKQNRGTVVAVGSGRIVPGHPEPMPLTVRVGHEVLFNRFSGVPLDEDKADDLVILREDEILAYRNLT